ncbi:MAG: M23 family metallopeptidase, partial [Propionibacteriaceae bacterium]|nr:M23 family metallopeptidase [Propionibacteriaceae bacterium]
GRSKAGNYYKTGYAHQSVILVKPGEEVTRGQLIGLIGDTGYSFGCHVHWNVFENGGLVNGYNYLMEVMMANAAN